MTGSRRRRKLRRHARPCRRASTILWRQSKTWMAGTSPAMTTWGSWIQRRLALLLLHLQHRLQRVVAELAVGRGMRRSVPFDRKRLLWNGARRASRARSRRLPRSRRSHPQCPRLAHIQRRACAASLSASAAAACRPPAAGCDGATRARSPLASRAISC